MPARRCTRHPDRGPQDRRPDGRCIHCSRETQREYRQRCRDAYAQLKAIQAIVA